MNDWNWKERKTEDCKLILSFEKFKQKQRPSLWLHQFWNHSLPFLGLLWDVSFYQFQLFFYGWPFVPIGKNESWQLGIHRRHRLMRKKKRSEGKRERKTRGLNEVSKLMLRRLKFQLELNCSSLVLVRDTMSRSFESWGLFGFWWTNRFHCSCLLLASRDGSGGCSLKSQIGSVADAGFNSILEDLTFSTQFPFLLTSRLQLCLCCQSSDLPILHDILPSASLDSILSFHGFRTLVDPTFDIHLIALQPVSSAFLPLPRFPFYLSRLTLVLLVEWTFVTTTTDSVRLGTVGWLREIWR